MQRMWAKIRVATWVDLDLEVPERTFDNESQLRADHPDWTEEQIAEARTVDNEAEVQAARTGAAVRANEVAAEMWPDADEIQVEEVSDRS